MRTLRRLVRVAALLLVGAAALVVSARAHEAAAPNQPPPLRIGLRQGGLVANIFSPAAAARCLAVLLLGGSGGGISTCTETIAQLLAGQGIVTMDLAYLGMEGLPSDLEGIPLEYLDHAMTSLRLQPYVDPERVGRAGGSKGGEVALLFASMRPDVRAVAVLVPSGIVFRAPPGASPTVLPRPRAPLRPLRQGGEAAQHRGLVLRRAAGGDARAGRGGDHPRRAHPRPHPAAQRQGGHALAVDRARRARRRLPTRQGLHLLC